VLTRCASAFDCAIFGGRCLETEIISEFRSAGQMYEEYKQEVRCEWRIVRELLQQACNYCSYRTKIECSLVSEIAVKTLWNNVHSVRCDEQSNASGVSDKQLGRLVVVMGRDFFWALWPVASCTIPRWKRMWPSDAQHGT
jgi:hypothetical protein